jgi:hypothetical protein
VRVTRLTTEHRALFVFSTLVLVALGCGSPPSTADAPDDEAMKRLNWEKKNLGVTKTPDEAAHDWFLPEYYYNPADKVDPVPNYCRGWTASP